MRSCAGIMGCSVRYEDIIAVGKLQSRMDPVSIKCFNDIPTSWHGIALRKARGKLINGSLCSFIMIIYEGESESDRSVASPLHEDSA